jgi:hypothetical protein
MLEAILNISRLWIHLSTMFLNGLSTRIQDSQFFLSQSWQRTSVENQLERTESLLFTTITIL